MTTTLTTLSPEDLRMVLDTVRQVRSMGLLSPTHFERLLAKLPRISSGEGSQVRFFKLNAAVVSDVDITGLASNYAGTTSGDPVDLVNWQGLLDGAPDNYIGLFPQVDGEWVFGQGPCISGGGGGGGNSLVFSLQTGLGF